jgi:hypothetical protein
MSIDYQDVVDAIDARILAVLQNDLTTLSDLHNKRLDGLQIDRNTTLAELRKLRSYYASLTTTQSGTVETHVVDMG